MSSLLQSGGVVNPKTDAKALIKAEALYEQIRKREYDVLMLNVIQIFLLRL